MIIDFKFSFSFQDCNEDNYSMLRHNNHYHLRSIWTGSRAQKEDYRKDLYWVYGLVVGLFIPICVGVFVVFNLTCMRNTAGFYGTMFGAGATNAEMMMYS